MQKLWLEIESSTVKTVGGDKCNNKEFFSIYKAEFAEKAKSTIAIQVGQSSYRAQAGMGIPCRSFS